MGQKFWKNWIITSLYNYDSKSSGAVSMTLSAMVGTGKEVMQFDFLLFLEIQKTNLQDNLRDSKCDEYYIFL